MWLQAGVRPSSDMQLDGAWPWVAAGQAGAGSTRPWRAARQMPLRFIQAGPRPPNAVIGLAAAQTRPGPINLAVAIRVTVGALKIWGAAIKRSWALRSLMHGSGRQRRPQLRWMAKGCHSAAAGAADGAPLQDESAVAVSTRWLRAAPGAEPSGSLACSGGVARSKGTVPELGESVV